ncbi:MAG TPA: hypothetical protein VES19_05025 [Candidatus Limnocylindrales bacterium]|nr:hypothetical protein [Candidatus Limnocylindrales bacterium]
MEQTWVVAAIPTLIAVGGAILLAALRPVMAMPLLIIGIAAHNLVLALLLAAGTPEPVVRVVQAWKDVIAVILVLHLLRRGWAALAAGGPRGLLRRWSDQPALVRTADLAIGGFALLLFVYLILPAGLLSVEPPPTLQQRILGFRMLALLPLIYASSRLLMPSSAIRLWAIAVGGTAVVVAMLGIVELFFLPTSGWLNLGIHEFTALQGFSYRGPGGLPENFFQSTTAGLGLRRMVSTYLSPLGIAYTGLLVVPMLVASALAWPKAARRWWLAFLVVGISLALSVTRLALLILVAEAALLFLVWPSRRLAVASGAATLLVVFALLIYPMLGPLVDFNLKDVRRPIGLVALEGVFLPSDVAVPPGGTRPPATPPPTTPAPAELVERMVDPAEPSIAGHLGALARGIPIVLRNPLGIGLGASVYRLGTGTGPEESALLGIAGEMGLPALALFCVAYGSLVLAGLRSLRRRPGPGMVPAAVIGVGGIGLLPIMLTSAIWGNLSVTYVFWSAAGLAVAAWQVGSNDRVEVAELRTERPPMSEQAVSPPRPS